MAEAMSTNTGYGARCEAFLPGHSHCKHGHVEDCPNPGECLPVVRDADGAMATPVRWNQHVKRWVVTEVAQS